MSLPKMSLIWCHAHAIPSYRGRSTLAAAGLLYRFPTPPIVPGVRRNAGSRQAPISHRHASHEKMNGMPCCRPRSEVRSGSPAMRASYRLATRLRDSPCRCAIAWTHCTTNVLLGWLGAAKATAACIATRLVLIGVWRDPSQPPN